MVDPLEKLSGSTFAWWLVVAEAAQVAWVKGSVAIWTGDAAVAGAASARTAIADTSKLLAPGRRWAAKAGRRWVIAGASRRRARALAGLRRARGPALSHRSSISTVPPRSWRTRRRNQARARYRSKPGVQVRSPSSLMAQAT